MSNLDDALHQQPNWPLGLPWVDENQMDNPNGAHIETIAENVRIGHYTYGVALERTHNGVTEVWPLTVPGNPFRGPAS